MRKLLTLVLLFITVQLLAQPFNNEWIDYSKIYYKFKVGTTGLYRINQSALPGDFINTPAQNFQLWRNGKQVALYTSTAIGALPSNGFIEFWGEKNDGVPDKVLYRDPTFQLSDRISLQTDTAAFFLTVNTSANLRYVDAANNVASNTLTAEPFFIHKQQFNFREQIARGFGEM